MNQRLRDEAAAGAQTEDSFPRPIDRLMGAYTMVAAPALLFPYRPAGWPLLLLLHLAVGHVVFRPAAFRRLFRRAAMLAPRIARVAADWYPLLLVPALYSELQPLNLSIWNGHYFDSQIMAVEHALFGEPSRDLAIAWPILLLSELLHGAYLSYYLIIYGPPLLLFITGRRAEFAVSVFTIMLAFFVHYVFFIYYPVQGPRYLFPAPGGVIAEGSMYQIAHRLLEAGSSRGAAFPSSHVGVSAAQVVLCIRYLPRLAPLTAVLTLALALGAVYGGFHYATDAIAGLLLGIGAALLAPFITRLLRARTVRPAQA